MSIATKDVKIAAPAAGGTSPAEAAQRQKTIDEALSEILHIATLPEITLKIIEVVENPDSTAKDLHQIISNDPALCARVLKVVNSAFYGLPGQIGSINRAIVLLGLNAVKNIAIAASLSKLFRGGQISPTFNARDLWAHTIAVGAASKLVAERANMGVADEAFLAGMMHDIGIVVEIQALRPKFTQVVDQIAGKDGGTFLDVEQQVIGVNHQDFGRALCERWKFPQSFALAAGFHHRPLELDRDRRSLACVVYVADVLAVRGRIGYVGTVSNTELNHDVLGELKLTPVAIEQISAALPEAFKVADQFMNG